MSWCCVPIPVPVPCPSAVAQSRVPLPCPSPVPVLPPLPCPLRARPSATMCLSRLHRDSAAPGPPRDPQSTWRPPRGDSPGVNPHQPPHIPTGGTGSGLDTEMAPWEHRDRHRDVRPPLTGASDSPTPAAARRGSWRWDFLPFLPKITLPGISNGPQPPPPCRGGGPGEGVWGILETWGGSLGGFRGVWVQGAGEGCIGAVGVVLGCWGGFGGRGQGLAHL